MLSDYLLLFIMFFVSLSFNIIFKLFMTWELVFFFSVMDASEPIVEAEVSHQNEVSNSGTDGVIMEKGSDILNSTVEYEGLDKGTVVDSLLGESGAFESSAEKDVERSSFLQEFTGLTIAKV
jgi:hypothetical protein